jgi:hypothetical protein
VGRPVMTLAPFMLAPEANALLETGRWCGGWCCWSSAGSSTEGEGAAAAGAGTLVSVAAGDAAGFVARRKQRYAQQESDRRG